MDNEKVERIGQIVGIALLLWVGAVGVIATTVLVFKWLLF